MTKRLISLDDLRYATGVFRVAPGTIVTPSARDFANSHGISIVFDVAPTAPAKGADRMAEPKGDLASRIDHTLLAPDAVESDIIALCEEARTHGFASVCINPTWVVAAERALRGSRVSVCAVVGFPTGAHPTTVKAEEAGSCVGDGATELDMVANSGWLKDGRYDEYTFDIATVRQRIGPDAILKVIIEATILATEDIVRAAALAAHAGANFIKTSTGVYGKARVEDIKLLGRVLPPEVRIKAAGGIRTAEEALAMIDAGADRIGSSHSVAMIWSGHDAPAIYPPSHH